MSVPTGSGRGAWRLGLLCVAIVASALLACRREPRRTTIDIVARADDDIDLGAARWPSDAGVKRAWLVDPLHLVLELAPDARTPKFTVQAEGACPLEIETSQAGPSQAVVAKPLFALTTDRPQVGFDKPFDIVLTPGCDLARKGEVTWEQVEGPKLSLTIASGGLRLSSRTLPLEATRAPDLPWGVVPFSQRTRGAYTFEARWSDDGRAFRRRVRVSSISRASGLPNLALGQRVMLGGAGWSVLERPPGGHANIEGTPSRAEFEADAQGRWKLRDGSGTELSLRVGTHEGTPLDCGRSECHAREASAVMDSPMTHVLERGMNGEFGPAYDVRCAEACHALGEPGLDDGGFVHVARERGMALPTPGPGGWDKLGRALRRVGGVGCTACHGTGFIPEPSSRWTILRADVCATCHDAPPRYGHVVAWQGSRMSRSDARAETRSGVCSTCHTTAGYLGAIGKGPVRAVPEAAAPMGITCAACHAPHGEHEARGLVRKVRSNEVFAHPSPDTVNGVCIACHGPSAPGAAPISGAPSGFSPFASAAMVLFEAPARTSGKPSAHAQHGCVGCHVGRSAPGEGHGGGHSFRATNSACLTCHAGSSPKEAPARDGRLVAARARDLFAELVARKLIVEAPARATPVASPPHARGVRIVADGALAEAARNVMLVVEDPAAGVHNAPYARALLDGAEATLHSAKP